MEATQSGADFHLPDEILSVMPTDPYDQLDLARKITSMAIASRVSRLEAETGRLRHRVAEKDRVVAELQEKLGQLDRTVQEADDRLRTSLEENIRLSKERDTLVLTTKRLSRELAKLETFKRHLMQSLSEHNPSHLEAVDIGTCEQSTSKSSCWKDDRSFGHTISNLSGSTESTYQEGNVGKMLSMPYFSSQLTSTATPKISTAGSSPRSFSATGSPKMASGSVSPTKYRLEGQNTLPQCYLSSKQSSATSSPTGRKPRIDGKEFFRQARNHLSYEQFGAFLANIKEFNAHRQSREETSTKAEEIFGADNKDLYLSFQGLLYRNLS